MLLLTLDFFVRLQFSIIYLSSFLYDNIQMKSIFVINKRLVQVSNEIRFSQPVRYELYELDQEQPDLIHQFSLHINHYRMGKIN